MNIRCERGSALLVVLGMVAFVVISAVAFSAYMRYSRAPSSFLRQTIASRMLVKAALAEAITEIDRAIGDNPHPGPGNIWRHGSYSYEVMTDSGPKSEQAGERNYWQGRVLMERPAGSYVDSEQTVATLTYEGLAYIPPAIINEVRYYSRRTPTAQWHGMDFDVGRYAFCAVDVSDFFDVNIMRANSPRSSSPSSKITLSYLFGGGDGKAWEELTDQFRECDEEHGVVTLGDKVPLISVADMNLAMEDKAYGGLQSPFCTFDHKENIVDMYRNVNNQEGVAKMTFVTDGWYPTPKNAGNGDVIDLAEAGEEGQPFKSDYIRQSQPYYQIAHEYSSKCAQRLRDFKLPWCGMAALFDYLDEDNVPVSLSLPTTERVPMVCGLAPNVAGEAKYKISGGGDNETDIPSDYNNSDESKATKRKVTRDYKYTLMLSPDLFSHVDALAAYPFRYNDGINESFELSGVGALFFATDAIGLRLGESPVDGLLFEELLKVTKPELRTDGVMVLPFNSGSGTPLQSEEVESDANIVRPYNLDVQGAEDFFVKLVETPFISAKITWDQERTIVDGVPTEWEPKDPNLDEPKSYNVSEGKCSIPPVGKGGAKTSFDVATVLKNGGVTLRLYYAVWARVKCGDDTVDLVPAWVNNDLLNSGNGNMDDAQSEVLLHDVFGPTAPILRFDTDFSMEPSLKNLSSLLPDGQPKEVDLKFLTEGIMVSDPRHNYAPESWYRTGTVTPEQWRNDAMDYAADRDGDLYMAISDQGYMQSVYELANLPRFCNDGFVETASHGSGSSQRFDDNTGHMSNVSLYGKETSTFAERGKEMNAEFMWKTYCPYKKYLDEGDGFEDLDIVSDGNGYKINPYTDSTNVMMAAFACTPLDWACASTNEPFVKMQAKDFNSGYAWGDEIYNSNGKIALGDIEEIGGKFMDEMRKADDVNWEDAWEDLWSDRLTEVEQSLGSDVKNVDKKFLYGYWRDCFAVKQQLFLVFVRAEPSMTGGGAKGCSPPQLGARAVALVWRDPFASFGSAQPHKTRVLFYRQFD